MITSETEFQFPVPFRPKSKGCYRVRWGTRVVPWMERAAPTLNAFDGSAALRGRNALHYAILAVRPRLLHALLTSP